ncbi:MAG: MFS transporter [Candidatus Methanomethylicia archaeon]|nr:MFS transporter [Candidatus Methanomethylicia archaeon]MDW7988623.1 MFS transporter [Nitrososphaerota archaeon]
MERKVILLCLAVVVMMVISIYQYSWSLFADSIITVFKWDSAIVGLAFTIFTYTSTFIQPFSGFLADTYGARKIAVIASLICGFGFIFSSWLSSPWHLYLSYGFGGLGVGVLYGISTALAIKWFPERRGLATGIVVFGFGSGTAIFNLIIQWMIENRGLTYTFQSTGIIILITTLIASSMYSYPTSSDKVKVRKSTSKDFKPLDMVLTWQWPLIYFSFIFTVAIVLIFAAQLKMFAKSLNIPSEYINLALIVFPIGNGLSRIIAGASSDVLGRVKAMFIFYMLLGASTFSIIYLGSNAVMFVLLSFLIALFGGSPFAFYPSIIGDYYGSYYATTNYGLTYTAKAWAGLISGWLSGYLYSVFGSYNQILLLLAFASMTAAFTSLLLKPPKKFEY